MTAQNEAYLKGAKDGSSLLHPWRPPAEYSLYIEYKRGWNEARYDRQQEDAYEDGE